MSKHTPGKWSVGTGQHANTYRHEIETVTERGRRIVVARIPTPKGRPEEATANARLIATAPDMLEALHGLAESDAQDDEHPCFCRSYSRAVGHVGYCEKARAVIAKAEGKS